jgi:hypothetical protein
VPARAPSLSPCLRAAEHHNIPHHPNPLFFLIFGCVGVDNTDVDITVDGLVCGLVANLFVGYTDRGRFSVGP